MRFKKNSTGFELNRLESRALFSAMTAPSNLSAALAAAGAAQSTATSTTVVNLTWQDNSTDEAAFAVERSGDGIYFSQIGTVPANATSFQDNAPLTAGYTYYYHVRALDGAGGTSDYSNMASISMAPELLPNAPTNLTATLQRGKKGASSVTLNWKDNSDNERWFYVDISTDGVHWTTVASTTSSSATIAGLKNGATYYFRVAAYNSSGLSAWSNAATLKM
jgi:fibronectin type 3 domain-containing protein